MYQVSEQTISENYVSLEEIITPPSPYYNWKVEIQNKKTYYIGSEFCPIKSGSFTINQSGMGKASLQFDNFDVPIIATDNIKIYRNGEIIYQGFVDTTPDPQGDKVSISPYSVNLKTALYNHDYTSTSVTIDQILSDMINEKDSQTSILYNASDVNTGSTVIFNPGLQYKYETMKKILDDLSKQIDNRYIGVDKNNYFYVRPFSTYINYEIFADDNMKYESIKVNEDLKGIKATRRQVFQESTDAGKTNYIGNIGYSTSSTSYPPLSAIENKVGIKEDKFTAPKGLDVASALNYAYQDLIAQSVIPLNVDINNLDYDAFPLEIGQKIRIQKSEDLIWRTIIDCESTSNWTGVTLSTDSKIDNYSVSFNSGHTISYFFGNNIKWRQPYKLGFYVKSNVMGNHFSFSLHSLQQKIGYYGASRGYASIGLASITTVSTSFIIPTQDVFYIPIDTVNNWIWVDREIIIDDFDYINFYSTGTTATIKIDEIKLYQQHKEEYQCNIIELGFKLGSSFVDVTAGNFYENIDDEFFKLDQEVQKLKQITEV